MDNFIAQNFSGIMFVLLAIGLVATCKLFLAALRGDIWRDDA